MGFFNELFNNIVESAASALVRKYQDMPIEELKSKWEYEFKSREYTKENMYKEPSSLSVLDEVYSSRVGKRSWKCLCESKLAAEEAEAKRRIAMENEARKKKQEQQKANQRFCAALESNEMVKEIISNLNNLGYDAFYIVVNNDEVICNNSEKSNLYIAKYKKYGYPELDANQRKLLCSYICKHLTLKYISKDKYTLELNDAPGGMRASW